MLTFSQVWGMNFAEVAPAISPNSENVSVCNSFFEIPVANVITIFTSKLHLLLLTYFLPQCVDDDAFNKRHSKHEIEEKRRKR